MAKTLTASDVRLLLASLTSESALTIAGATNANPSVINVTGHGLSVGDVVFIVGTTGNTAINGVRVVAHVTDANHFDCTDFFAGTAVAGNGTTGGSPTATRIKINLRPGDLNDLKFYLSKLSSASGPFADVNRASESSVATIVGQ